MAHVRIIALLLLAALALPATAAAQCATDDLDMNGVPDVCPPGSNYIAGTAGGDFIWGTNGDDCIFTFGGNDFILGRGGNDYICGGDGGDTIFSGGGGDQVFGEGGDDFIGGGSGDDIVDGGDGNDNLFGSGGDDTIDGGAGNDNVDGGAGDDSLSGGAGDDSVDGGGGTDTCVDEPGGVDNCATITYAAVRYFDVLRTADGLAVGWDTTTEIGTVAFRLWRIEANGALVWVGELGASAEGSPHGASYILYDETAPADGPLEYLLEERTVNGGSVQYGPFLRSPNGAGVRDVLSKTGQNRGRTAHSVALRRLSRPAFTRSLASLGRKSLPAPIAAVVVVDSLDVIEVDAASIAEALQLTTGGVAELIRTGGLHLRLAGESVAWRSVDGGAALRFVSHELLTPFAKQRRYLLSIEDGVTMESPALEPSVGTEAHEFSETRRFEQNLFPGTTGAPDPREDIFFWHALSSEAQESIATPLPTLSGSEADELRLYVHGATQHAEQPHRVELHWNGQSLGVFDLSGRRRHTITASLEGISASTENELIVEQKLAGEAPAVLYVDAVEIDYPRLAEVDGAHFRFGGADGGEQVLTGLSGGTVDLYDITEPNTPAHFGAAPLDENGRLSFRNDEPARRYLVAASDAVSAPLEVAAHFGSSLASSDHDAEYIIIAASHLLDDARALADLREADGYRVLLVDVDDIYWAFADGEPDPLAVRYFLSFAWQHWSSAPRFVALVGKGSMDYRDLMGLGGNWLPSALAVTDGGLFPSDSMLGDVVGDDGLPEIAVGRLPVSSGDELGRIIEAIEEFEASRDTGSVLFAADDSEEQEFAAAARALGVWTAPQRRQDIDLNVETLQDARDRVMSSWEGSLTWLSYVGHGGLDRLATEGLLTSADVSALAQTQSSPVVLGWTCNMVRFDIPGFFSLGEQLLTEGSSAGVFSATGWSNHGHTDELRAAFTAVAFSSDAETIGDAMVWAHRAASEAPLDLHRVYMLLGDPALRLRAAKSQPEPDPDRDPDPGPDPGSDPEPGDLGSDPIGPTRANDQAQPSASGCAVSASGSAQIPAALAFMVFAIGLLLRRRRLPSGFR